MLLTILFVSAISIIVIQSPATEAQTPTQITIYANEYKFGTSSSILTSPGPTLTLTSGDTVTVTLMNIGAFGHGWAITDQPQTDANRLFSATIGSGSSPIAAGGQGSVTFTVGAPGTYYYICPVPGHVSLGMWGIVQVVSSGATASPTANPTATASASPSPTSPAPTPTTTVSASPSATASASPSATAHATPSKSPTPSPTIPELSAIVLIGIMAAAVATALIAKKRLSIPVA